jgi:thiol-disulfide isomerase/thioredoxin
MLKLFQKKPFYSILSIIKRIVIVGALLLILRYTGLLAGVTEAASGAILKTGLYNFTPEQSETETAFDYNFSVKTLDGVTKPISDFKGKVIFLNLWATWCGPCRAEMPGIQKLYDRITKEHIEFIMLSIDRPGSEQKIKTYIESQSHTFPVYVPQGYLPEQLNVPSIPTTFIINKQGVIVSKKVGMTNFNTSKFENYLEELAAEK